MHFKVCRPTPPLFSIRTNLRSGWATTTWMWWLWRWKRKTLKPFGSTKTSMFFWSICSGDKFVIMFVLNVCSEILVNLISGSSLASSSTFPIAMCFGTIWLPCLPLLVAIGLLCVVSIHSSITSIPSSRSQSWLVMYVGHCSICIFQLNSVVFNRMLTLSHIYKNNSTMQRPKYLSSLTRRLPRHPTNGCEKARQQQQRAKIVPITSNLKFVVFKWLS